MELTKEFFDEFLTRLKYQHRGKGVDDHCTAHPMFTVQCLKYIPGISLEYDPDYFWIDSDHEGEYSAKEFEEVLDEYISDGNIIDKFDKKYDDVVTIDGGAEIIFQRVGYVETWEHVNSHLTKEGAEAFIKRKKHDYKELRIYVDSQYHCWEFNTIIDGLLSGKITLKE